MARQAEFVHGDFKRLFMISTSSHFRTNNIRFLSGKKIEHYKKWKNKKRTNRTKNADHKARCNNI